MTPSKYNLKSLLIILSVCAFSNAQVAINNTNPQGVFHVDGAKDNPSTGSPTAAQQANDFVVKADGKVGIGTTTPTDKIEVAGGNISISSYEYKTAADDDHKAGELNFRLGGNTAERFTPVSSIVAYDKWKGSNYAGDLAIKTYGNAALSEAVRIASTGNVGIGTTDPQSRLHIRTPIVSGGFQLQDGSQGAGKILTGDAQGRASWTILPAVTASVLGTLNTTERTITSNSLINSSITLPTGKWLVYVGQLVRATEASTVNKNLWMRITLSNSNTALTYIGFSFLGSSMASGWTSTMIRNGLSSLSFISGVIPVQVTAPTVLSTWFAACDTGSGGSPGTVTIGDNAENYLFAVPFN